MVRRTKNAFGCNGLRTPLPKPFIFHQPTCPQVWGAIRWTSLWLEAAIGWRGSTFLRWRTPASAHPAGSHNTDLPACARVRAVPQQSAGAHYRTLAPLRASDVKELVGTKERSSAPQGSNKEIWSNKQPRWGGIYTKTYGYAILNPHL